MVLVDINIGIQEIQHVVQLLDQLVLVQTIALDHLVIVHNMFIKLAPGKQKGFALA